MHSINLNKHYNSFSPQNAYSTGNGRVKLIRRKKFINAFSTLLILFLCCLNFGPELLSGRSLEALRELYPIAQKWKDERKPAEVPRLIHFVLLGRNTPKHFVKMVEFNTKVAKENGFEVIVWRDEDADMLVKFHQYKFPGLVKTWDMVKKTEKHSGIEAIKADFVRNLIMWALGGVYLDADFIACSSIDFMVDTPGVISFPIMPENTQDISSAAMSAPPHHRLFELLLENMIDHVDELDTSKEITISTMQNLLVKATDEYFKEIKVSLESIREGTNMPFAAEPVEGVIEINEDGSKGLFGATVADIRFRADIGKHDLFHLTVKSWLIGGEMKSICFDNPDLITPFLAKTCRSDLSNVNEIDFGTKCGHNLNERDLETETVETFSNITVDDDFIFAYADEERARKFISKNPIYRRFLKKMCDNNENYYCP